MFQKTTALDKLSKLEKRIRFVNGGTSSSKTISILMLLIDYAQTHDKEIISVVSESLPHLKLGAIRDFLRIMQEHNYFKEARWNATDKVYTFETGSVLEFFSADQPGKVRGPRRDVLYINEANNVDYAIFDQLEIRTDKIIWIDSNPTHEYWAYTELIAKRRDEVDFLTLTYKDNEGLPYNIINAIEARRSNVNWYRVYGLGELGDIDERIYTGWAIIDAIPHEARLVRRGLDYGYTNDPTAIVDLYEHNGGYILDEKLYRHGMHNKEIADFLLSLPYTLTIPDSSEPKSNDELSSYGVVLTPAQKGADSVLHGIQNMQMQKISATKSSINLIKEYRSYLWLRDKNGKVINEPVGPDHALDASRYAVTSLKGNTQDVKSLLAAIPTTHRFDREGNY